MIEADNLCNICVFFSN